MGALKEDAFDVTDDGIKKLAELQAENDDPDNEIPEIIDADAETEEEVEEKEANDEYVGKVVCECPVCHSFIFKDVADIDIDKETELANVSDDCPYCCEVGGFKIVGIVSEYNAEDAEEAKEDEAEAEEAEEAPAEEAEEAPAEGAEEAAEAEDAEEVDEGLLPGLDGLPGLPGLPGLGCDGAKDEGLIGDIANAAGNAVQGVVGAVVGESKCADGDCDEGLIPGLDSLPGLPKLPGLSEEDVVKACNEAFGEDGWTAVEDFDDEDADCEFCVKNGEESLGKFRCKNGKICRAESCKGDDCDDKLDEDIAINREDGETSIEADGVEVAVKDDEVSIETADEIVTLGDKGAEEAPAEEAPAEEAHAEEAPAEEVPAEEAPAEEIPAEEGEEVVSELSDEEKAQLENPQNESVDIDLKEFEEESFNRLGEKFLKRTYENVASFKTTGVHADDTRLKLEGVITFKSGKTRPTEFMFEARDITRTGKVRFIGENKQICSGKKSFTMTGKIANGKLMSESLNYNFYTKNSDGKSSRVYGTVSNKK